MHQTETFPFISDATTTGEQVNLQTQLKSLSTEIVTLRSRLHVPGEQPNGEVPAGAQNPPTMVRPPVQKFQQSGCAPPLQNGHIQQPVFNGELIQVFTLPRV